MVKQSLENKDTKTKILLVANKLFARSGFDGVSIRDIAQEADVNVASINYHFNNKLNLLHEIFDYNYNFIDEQITEITESEKLTTLQLSGKLFELFMNNGPALINGFKMILSDHLTPPIDKTVGRSLGPPGAAAILKTITEEFGEELPIRAREWAVRMLVTNIFHQVTLIKSSYCSNFHKGEYWAEDDYKRFELEQLTKALISHMTSKSQAWDNS